MTARFKWLGLKPMGANGTYFLPYDLSLGSLGTRTRTSSSRRARRSGARYDLTTGFYPHRYSASAHARPAISSSRTSASSPRHSATTISAGDVRGKVLLVLDHEPGETDSTSVFDGVVTSEYTNPLKKALAAQARGAAAVLFVTDVQNHQAPQNFEAATRAYWPAQPPRSSAVHARGVGRQAHDSRRSDFRRARRQPRAREREIARRPGARVGERARIAAGRRSRACA